MDKKVLRQYRILRAKIARLDMRIAQMKYLTWDVVRSSDPKRTLVIRGLYNGPELRELRAERDRCFAACREVEDFIQSVEDGVTREIFTLRYLDGLTWRDIAQKIGGGNTEEGVRKVCERYLRKY